MARKGEVLAVAKPASGEQNGEVGVVVDIGIAHIAAKEHHGTVEQAVGSLPSGGETVEVAGEDGHVLSIGSLELAHFDLVVTVMAQSVVSLGGVSLALEPKDRSLKSVEHEGDQAG